MKYFIANVVIERLEYLLILSSANKEKNEFLLPQMCLSFCEMIIHNCIKPTITHLLKYFKKYRLNGILINYFIEYMEGD